MDMSKMESKLLVTVFCLQLLRTEAHFHPFDPYAPHDPNNGYPQHFCDLNDDEFGRPYLGPFDQHVNSSARNPFPKVPPPDNQPQYQTLPPELEELLDGETDVYTRLPSGEVMKRQSPPLPGCTTLNECSMPPQRCTGSGTQYDTCGRRCTCTQGLLTNCCRVRKEWRSMTQAERCRYISVVVTASTQPQWKPCYDSLVNLHTTFFDLGIHTITYFLPWHRWYLLQLENLLRRIDCTITVPYWDWSLESQGWQNSIVWNAQCGFGGNGDQSTNSLRVTTGPFRWQAWTQPNGSPLSRSFNDVLPDCAAVAMAQRMTVNQFRTWHAIIQGNFHNTVHCNIGGTMCSSASANDPIFFLHHGFVDRMWSDWQANGVAYKNLAFFTLNTTPMPGASGATPATTYDLQNQPGCVRVCIQQPTQACCTNTTYAPVCPRDMNDKHYSPLKLARLIHRPYPNVSDIGFKVFHSTFEETLLAKRFGNLLNDYEKLNSVLSNNGYTNDMLKSSQPSTGFVDFERYLFRPQIFESNMRESIIARKCLPYVYGQA